MHAFKFPLLLDPGFFEHVAHVWKGKLAKDESEENVSLLNSGAKRFQVPSCGILDGFLLALGVREFWKERHWSIIDNDDRDAVVEISEPKFVAAAALGTCRSQPEKLEPVQSGQVIQFFIKGVRGTHLQVVRGGSQDALGLVAGVMGMDLYAMVGGKVVDHSLSLECILGSGRVHSASRSVAGQCVLSAMGVVLLVKLNPSLSMTKKGKDPKALWDVLLRKDPALCRPPQVVGHMWCPREEALPGREWEILLHTLLLLLLSLLKTWSRHSCSFRMS